MNTSLPLEFLIGAFIGLLIAMVVLLVLQVRTTNQVNKLTFPAYEYVIKKAEHEANAIVQKAQQKAQSIITDAEKAGHAAISEYTNQATQIHEQYRDSVQEQTEGIMSALREVSEVQTHAVEKLTKTAQEGVTAQQNEVTQHVTQTNEKIAHTISQIETDSQAQMKALREEIGSIGKTLTDQLQKVEVSGEQQIAAHVASLQHAADAHIEAYEVSRKKLMDRHIEQLVESVVMKVLHTQVPISEHASLAREALEEAKAKHIL